MKLMKGFFAVALIMSFLTYTNQCNAQKVYPQCSSLRGIEDSNGNTQLFYRIYSYSVDAQYYNTSYDIWRYDVAKKQDIMYLDNSESYSIVGFMDFGFIINGYQFWKNDFTKYIFSYTGYGSDIGASIRRSININCSNYAMHYPYRFYISAQNENLLYTEKGGKSIDGGLTWSADALIKGNISALSPVNDSVLYFRDNAYRLCKTLNRGYSAFVIDSTIAQADTFAFSSDGIHVFRISNITSNSCRFSISSNAGEYGSWTGLDSASAGMFLSLDDMNKRVYIGYGKTIKVYDFDGNLQTEKYNLKKELLGLYKKPGTDKLYVLTKYELDEYTAGNKTILKQLPVPPDLAQWHPLAVGNKWVYEEKSTDWQGEHTGSYSVDITGDTILPNGKLYFRVSDSFGSEFQRYDTLTGKLYQYKDSTDSTIDETYIDISDTLYCADSFTLPGRPKYAYIKDEGTMSLFTKSFSYRNFSSVDNFGDIITYTLTKGIGLSSYVTNMDFVGTYGQLKACRINGTGYGDTTLLAVNGRIETNPIKFALEQNYPNPFNPSTAIRYSIPKAGQVKLNVYSVTGKLVASLVDEYKTAGSYTVNFNAANLSSGVYFYRLTSGSSVENKKMILLK